MNWNIQNLLNYPIYSLLPNKTSARSIDKAFYTLFVFQFNLQVIVNT